MKIKEQQTYKNVMLLCASPAALLLHVKRKWKMKPYKSKSGKNSGVTGYQAGKDYIIVQFKSGEVYKYTNASAGIEMIEKMKKLAAANVGLSTFISQFNPAYENKS